MSPPASMARRCAATSCSDGSPENTPIWACGIRLIVRLEDNTPARALRISSEAATPVAVQLAPSTPTPRGLQPRARSWRAREPPGRNHQPHRERAQALVVCSRTLRGFVLKLGGLPNGAFVDHADLGGDSVRLRERLAGPLLEFLELGLEFVVAHAERDYAACRIRAARLPRVHLPQHADEHRPKDAILLAVDQELGEGPRLGVPQYAHRSRRRGRSRAASGRGGVRLGERGRARRGGLLVGAQAHQVSSGIGLRGLLGDGLGCPIPES